MDQKAKQIQASVPGATVTRVGEGLVVTFDSGLLFDFDSDVLRAASRQNLVAGLDNRPEKVNIRLRSAAA